MVEHRPAQNRFVLTVPGGEAQLVYRKTSPTVIDMVSTFVPSAARGQGVASKLAEAALIYARDHGMQVIPSCWYVGEYIDKHPDFSGLLAPVQGRAAGTSDASCEIG